MKKILSSVLCLAMLLSMGTTAFASEVAPVVDPNEISTDGGSQNVTVTYGMSEGFTVTIPTNFTIDDSAKATAKVSASNVVIAHGSTLKVAVSGNDYVDSWELVDEAEATNTLTYTIGTTDGGADIVNDSVVLSVGAGDAYNDTVEETMYFTVTDTLSKAGTYTDTLTFTVEVVGGSNNGGSGSGTYVATFADNSWSDIVTAVQNDEVPTTWNVGDTKAMEINGQEYNIQIIGKDHDTYTSGGTAPLTFQLVELYGTKAKMNKTNDNTTGWSGSAMRTTTMSEILSAMPNEVQSAIKAVDKETLKGDKSGLETTSDKLFLLSEVEVFSTTNYSDGNAEGSQYAFYANGGSTIKNFEGSPALWWLRGPRYNYSNIFSIVYSDGTLSSGNAYYTYGVAFGFCF